MEKIRETTSKQTGYKRDYRSEFSDKLRYRDIRVLDDRRFFEVLDAKRKTIQAKKDFINDQDSTAGPSVIDNMIRNILTVRRGTFEEETRFGIDVDAMLFENLDWASLEFMRTIIFNDLSNQIPNNITITHIELHAEGDVLTIEIAYNIKYPEGSNKPNWQQPGPETIGERIAYVNLSIANVQRP